MSKLTLKEIAKLVRTEITAKVKAGELPRGIKVSVRTDYYSMGCSLNVSVTALPEGFPLLNRARVAFENENPHWGYWNMPEETRERFSAEGRQVLAVLNAIVDEYHYSRRHDFPNDDIVDQNFHKSVDIGGDLERSDRKRVEAELRAEQQAAEAAAATVVAPALVEPTAVPAAAPAAKPRVYLRAVIGNRVG
jgi:hypothetical protein